MNTSSRQPATHDSLQQNSVVDLTAEDAESTEGGPQAVQPLGVRSTYTYNQEDSGEQLMIQLGRARGTDLIGPLLAHSHAFSTVVYKPPAEKFSPPTCVTVERYDKTIHWTPKHEPRLHAVFDRAFDQGKGTGSYEVVGREMGQHSAVGYVSGLEPHPTKARSGGSAARCDPNLAAGTKRRDRANKPQKSQKPKKGSFSTSSFTGHPAAEDPVPADVPIEVAQLVTAIRAVKRNKLGLPIRTAFREAPEFLGHFGRGDSRLKEKSPLMRYYGDERLFPTEWWEYLTAKVVCR